MITIVNYGLGNIQAFQDIYKRLNIPVIVASNSDDLSGAKKIILPGVGSFDWAMSQLDKSGMRSKLDELVLSNKIPILGVCVGMQMMAKQSEEGKLNGLGWIQASVQRFDEATFSCQTHLPHMGWNDVNPTQNNPLFIKIKAPRFYFLHSYFFKPDNESETIATTDYNSIFTSAVMSENIFGTQFHPEKSHHWGVQLLKNFAEL